MLEVDDELNITELVWLGLRYEGFDVSSAQDGRGALRADGIWAPVIFLTAGCDRDTICRRERRRPECSGTSTGCSMRIGWRSHGLNASCESPVGQPLRAAQPIEDRAASAPGRY
ncbi:MAG: hypothetical protein WAL22_23290 [Solirubrobacteraceae bacterium]